MAYCWVNQPAVIHKATHEASPLSATQMGRREKLGRRRQWALALFVSLSAFPSKESHSESSGQLLWPVAPCGPLLRTQMEIVLGFFWSGGHKCLDWRKVKGQSCNIQGLAFVFSGNSEDIRGSRAPGI